MNLIVLKIIYIVTLTSVGHERSSQRGGLPLPVKHTYTDDKFEESPSEIAGAIHSGVNYEIADEAASWCSRLQMDVGGAERQRACKLAER